MKIPEEVLTGSKIVIRVEFECKDIPNTRDMIRGLRKAAKDIGRPRKVNMVREKDGEVVQTVHGGVTWEGDNLKALLFSSG